MAQCVSFHMTGAILAALASAFCFALAAALQQHEALQAADLGVADPRLLWRLAHRPLWLVGVVADGLSAALHVVALSLGSIALVQPLGVTGLLFAIPLVALLRRQRIPGRDVAVAVVVLAALSALLRFFPAATATPASSARALVWVVAVTLLVDAGAVALARIVPARARALLLAAGAGVSFGIAAVLVRTLLEMVGRSSAATATIIAGAGIALLIPVGYLQLQNAYRAGYFAASLATAVVSDPVAAIIGGIFILHEPLPRSGREAVIVMLCALVVIAGIATLVRSPAHLFTIAEADQRPA